MVKKYLAILILTTVSLLGNSNFGSIITGSQTGTYIQLGNDLSDVFANYNADLKVLSSQGSVENLNVLTGKSFNKNAHWAIVQSDALDYYKFLHFKSTREELNEIIKVVLPLYNEHIHIIAKKGKKFDFKQGLIYKIGVSSKESGSNITANLIENAYKVTFQYHYVDFKKAIKYLNEDKLDMFFDVISFPNEKYKSLNGITLVNLPQNAIMDKNYIRASFSKNQYKWLNKTVKGYKVPSVIVTKKIEKKYNQSIAVFLKVILKNYKNLMTNGHQKWRKAYKNKNLKISNMHPIATSILEKYE